MNGVTGRWTLLVDQTAPGGIRKPGLTATAPARRRGRSDGLARGGLALAALALAAGLALHPGHGTAQPARVPLPGLGPADPRHPVDLALPPWRGLGRVQLEIGGRCTGALVGPRLVLTAAHCLVAPRSRQWVQPGTLHFMLGYDRGAAVAHARVVAYRTGPGFRPDQLGPASSDWAVLTLDAALGTPDRVLPLADVPPPPGTPLLLGGYQQDRPERLLADTGCRSLDLRGVAAGMPMLAHGCAATRGASGGPLLMRGAEGRWAIAGVASASRPDAALGYAVPAGLITLPEP